MQHVCAAAEEYSMSHWKFYEPSWIFFTYFTKHSYHFGPEPSFNGWFAEFRLTFRFWITMVRVAQIRFRACSTFVQQLKNIQCHTGSSMNLPEYSSMLRMRGLKYPSHRPDASRHFKYSYHGNGWLMTHNIRLTSATSRACILWLSRAFLSILYK